MKFLRLNDLPLAGMLLGRPVPLVPNWVDGGFQVKRQHPAGGPHQPRRE